MTKVSTSVSMQTVIEMLEGVMVVAAEGDGSSGVDGVSVGDWNILKGVRAQMDNIAKNKGLVRYNSERSNVIAQAIRKVL
jgi:hypothetical protein